MMAESKWASTIAIARDTPVPQRMNTHAQPPRYTSCSSKSWSSVILPLALVLALLGCGFDREPPKR